MQTLSNKLILSIKCGKGLKPLCIRKNLNAFYFSSISRSLVSFNDKRDGGSEPLPENSINMQVGIKVEDCSKKTSIEIRRLLQKDQIFEYLFEKYEELCTEHLKELLKKINGFYLHEDDKLSISKIFEIFKKERTSKLDSGELLSEAIKIALSFTSNNDKSNTILSDLNTILLGKIQCFSKENIKVVFMFYSNYYNQNHSANHEIWDDFLSEVLNKNLYFNVRDIAIFDLLEIVNYCFKEKSTTNSLNDSNFNFFLQIFLEKWEKYLIENTEEEVVLDLLSNDTILESIKLLYHYSSSLLVKYSMNKDFLGSSLSLQVKEMSIISEYCFRIVNLDLKEIMETSFYKDFETSTYEEEDLFSFPKF